MSSDIIQSLISSAQTKIVMLIMDGLGGLPRELGGNTELETANTPNLDLLANKSSLGLSIPVAPGITSGSGPGHLALFGYDPLQYEIGRGVLEALGVGFELGPHDLAARGNYCTIAASGRITDRRAGRIATEINIELSRILETIKIEDSEVFIKPVKEHRFAFVMRSKGLDDRLSDTDPLITGIPPLKVYAQDVASEKAARYINQFISIAQVLLADRHPANMILLRGFARFPSLPTFRKKYGLNAAAIAVNGMYRGVGRIVGMQVLDVGGQTVEDEIITLEKNWGMYDFFYLHVKKTDTCGENGDFEGKVRAIEEVDGLIPRILALNPDVLIVSGDHSSPAVLKSHSWHPVPTLIHSQYVRADGIPEYGERACARGSLGVFPATQIMPVALANAMRLNKYGA